MRRAWAGMHLQGSIAQWFLDSRAIDCRSIGRVFDSRWALLCLSRFFVTYRIRFLKVRAERCVIGCGVFLTAVWGGRSGEGVRWNGDDEGHFEMFGMLVFYFESGEEEPGLPTPMV